MSLPDVGSELECAILGLLCQTERSGYDLMKVFSETALGSFSSSPGTIYPAVRRLQGRGLIRGEIQKPNTLRPRQVFRLTPAGSSAFKRYLTSPVTRAEVVRGGGGVLLRFAFAGEMLGPAAAARILEQFATTIEAYLPELKAQRATLAKRSQTFGRHALQRGIAGYESDARWARRVARELASDAPVQRRARSPKRIVARRGGSS